MGGRAGGWRGAGSVSVSVSGPQGKWVCRTDSAMNEGNQGNEGMIMFPLSHLNIHRLIHGHRAGPAGMPLCSRSHLPQQPPRRPPAPFLPAAAAGRPTALFCS